MGRVTKLANISLDFEGLSNLHRFFSQQLNGWEKRPDDLPKELEDSKTYFENSEKNIGEYVKTRINLPESHLASDFINIKPQFVNNINKIFTYDCPEVDFLIDVNAKHPSAFINAYNYLTGTFNQYINSKDMFNGYLLAYEFSLKDITQITERRNKEKPSINKIRADFQSSLTESENQLTEYLKGATDKYQEFGTSLEEFKTDKEKTYSDWFINTKGDFESFTTESYNHVADLEKTYKEKLKLEEPAKYWADRASNLKRQGWITLLILIFFVLIVVSSLGKLLWNTPEQIYTSFFDDDKSAAIRWSIIYVTFISFMAFCIKAISKVMFSSFHLARDSEERHTLTYFYLSLLKDASVDEKDKQLIMQSLFSRAETGLLKDDSSPTMPNDMVGKFFSK
jgi:hypothetical protein